MGLRTPHGFSTPHGLNTPHKDLQEFQNEVALFNELSAQLYPTGRAFYKNEKGQFRALGRGDKYVFCSTHRGRKFVYRWYFPRQ